MCLSKGRFRLLKFCENTSDGVKLIIYRNVG